LRLLLRIVLAFIAGVVLVGILGLLFAPDDTAMRCVPPTVGNARCP
jgi:hypothetical protein